MTYLILNMVLRAHQKKVFNLVLKLSEAALYSPQLLHTMTFHYFK